MTGFSLSRLIGLVRKETIQLRRDRMTLAMLIAMPLMQLVLFGYAINADPRGLPTAVVAADASAYTRSYLKALENTGYFDFAPGVVTERQADNLLQGGDVLFVLTIPADFTRRLVRGERPALLLEVDGTDPIASGNAISAAVRVTERAFDHDLKGSLADLKAVPGPAQLIVHRRYNPEGITQYNTVPGLIGVILTLTLVMLASIGLTRERERGTLENLYAMPLLPLEVMIGKITPFIVGAYVQVAFVLVMAKVIFDIPIVGSMGLFSLGLVAFVTANLAIGFTFSTISKTQLQAVQMSAFFFMPSILLSGFMFPYRGMPIWAQWLGEILPLTHFLRITRGILLKDASFVQVWPNIWPLLVILGVISVVALSRYRATLD